MFCGDFPHYLEQFLKTIRQSHIFSPDLSHLHRCEIKAHKIYYICILIHTYIDNEFGIVNNITHISYAMHTKTSLSIRQYIEI